jgi:predicted nucleic acid-binding protein
VRFVLDASVALAWVLREQDPSVTAYADAVFEAVQRGGDQALVPEVWHAEVAGVLLRQLRARILTQEAFEGGIELFGAMRLETHHQPYRLGTLVARAQQLRLQAIDVLYFDLASSLELAIATVDRGLRSAARSHGVALVAPASD